MRVYLPNGVYEITDLKQVTDDRITPIHTYMQKNMHGKGSCVYEMKFKSSGESIYVCLFLNEVRELLENNYLLIESDRIIPIEIDKIIDGVNRYTPVDYRLAFKVEADLELSGQPEYKNVSLLFYRGYISEYNLPDIEGSHIVKYSGMLSYEEMEKQCKIFSTFFKQSSLMDLYQFYNFNFNFVVPYVEGCTYTLKNIKIKEVTPYESMESFLDDWFDSFRKTSL